MKSDFSNFEDDARTSQLVEHLETMNSGEWFDMFELEMAVDELEFRVNRGSEFDPELIRLLASHRYVSSFAERARIPAAQRRKTWEENRMWDERQRAGRWYIPDEDVRCDLEALGAEDD